MSMLGRDPREDEVMRALATYLEILESGGDGEAFLRRHTEMETELRVLAGIDAGLRVRVPEPLFAGKEAVRRKFQAAIREDQTTARALAWFKPRLFGIIGAIGVGAGLTGAFASGALPSEPISNIIGSLPVVGNAFSAPSTPLEQLGNPADGHRLEPLQEQAAPFNEHRPSDPGHPIDDAPASDSESRLIETGPSESPNAGAEGLPGNAEPPAPAAREVDARSNGVVTDGTPPGQGGENPGNGDENGRGIGPDGTPPGQGGENPGNGNSNGVGNRGTPPGHGGENPSNDGGIGIAATPPDQAENGAPGNSQSEGARVADGR